MTKQLKSANMPENVEGVHLRLTSTTPTPSKAGKADMCCVNKGIYSSAI